MDSLEDKINEVKLKHDKEVLDLKDHDILSKLIPSLKKASYHGYELYGLKASITLDVQNIDQCLDLINELRLAGVKLVPMGAERDSCFSVKRLDLCKLDKTIPIASIVYKIDSFRSEIEIYLEIDGIHYEIVMRTAFRHDFVFNRLFWRSIRYKSEHSEKAIDCTFNYSSDFMDYQVKFWSSDIEKSSYGLFSKVVTIGLDELFDELKRVKS